MDRSISRVIGPIDVISIASLIILMTSRLADQRTRTASGIDRNKVKVWSSYRPVMDASLSTVRQFHLGS